MCRKNESRGEDRKQTIESSNCQNAMMRDLADDKRNRTNNIDNKPISRSDSISSSSTSRRNSNNCNHNVVKKIIEAKRKCSHGLIPKRYIILLLCMLVNLISYTIRTNINITIVEMVTDDDDDDDQSGGAKFKTKFAENSCPAPDYIDDDVKLIFARVPILNKTFTRSYQGLPTDLNTKFAPQSLSQKTDQERRSPNAQTFDWSESLQGTILGAFFYGYIVSMAAGAVLIDLAGAKTMVAISILGAGACTLAIPYAASCSAYIVVALRIITGLLQGLVTPSIYTLLPRWTPKSELGLAFGLICASGNFGAVITMPICGVLSQYGFAGGWPSVFYVFGGVSLLFFIPWMTLVHNTPDDHPSISEHERTYIAANLSISNNVDDATGERKKRPVAPWGSILTSRKVWSIGVTRFCGAWGSLFLMSKLPAYLKSILHMPITYNGFVNSSIYITLGASALWWGYVSDFISRRDLISRTVSRKLFQSIGLLGCALAVGLVPSLECDVLAIVILINVSMLTYGLTAGGEALIVIDIAPDFSGSVYGLTNGIASLPGVLAPLFIGLLLDQPGANEMQQWNILFWISGAINVFGVLIFVLLTDSNVEKWGRASDPAVDVEADLRSKTSKYDYETRSKSKNIDEKQLTLKVCDQNIINHSNKQ